MSIQMSIQRIAAVAAEVRSLRRADAPAPGAFATALGRATETGAAAAPSGPVGALASALPQAGGWTLGAMLGGRGGLGALAAASALPVALPAAVSAALAPVAPGGLQAVAPAAAPTRGAATAGGLVMPVEGRFSSRFGPRVHPITGQSRMHSGVDLAAPAGTPIAAAAAGTVSFSGPRGGYGNLVIVSHADGSETRYAHNEANLVTVGQQVAAGEQIARVGSTGMSTGPHLHFEVRRGGEAVDPAPLLGLT